MMPCSLVALPVNGGVGGWPMMANHFGPCAFLIELNEIYQGDQHRHWLCAKEV